MGNALDSLNVELVAFIHSKTIAIAVDIEEVPLFVGILMNFDPSATSLGNIILNIANVMIHISDIAK
jgi:hypothetical protein